METPQTLPILDAAELRVLGSLMEKSKTTPDYYPMTINGLTAACNQKTSRKPVVQYDDELVANTLNTLKRRGLISTATGGSNRVIKYKHNFAIVFPLIPSELALMCLLMLRGPQTPGELNTNSGRLWEFDSIEEVQEVLEKLAGGDTPYVVQLPKRPGQKEARYAHLLGGEPEITDEDDEEPISYTGGRLENGVEARLDKIEQTLAELKDSIDQLIKALG